MIRILIFSILPLLFVSCTATDIKSDKPNVIVILADDMGSGDIQRMNPKSVIPTPGLNSLIDEGILFILFRFSGEIPIYVL